MAYMTPELLLVGAAQHLVLGHDPDWSRLGGCDLDEVTAPMSDLAELW